MWRLTGRLGLSLLGELLLDRLMLGLLEHGHVVTSKIRSLEVST